MLCIVVNYNDRASELEGIVNLVDYKDGPVYHALSVHLCRAKSITHFDDRYAESKLPKSRVWDKVQREVP